MEAVQEETDSKETLRPSSLRNLCQKNKLQVNTPTNILTVWTETARESFDIEPNNSDGDAFDEEACVIRDSDEDMHSDDF